MISDVLFLVYFALPGALANMAPVFAASGNWLPQLNKPIDFGAHFRSKRLLGNNKTFRGLFFGFIFALIAVGLQQWIFNSSPLIRDWSLVDYQSINGLALAFLLTIGALGGDAVKSFFKRQIGIKPGQSWMPFDQVDSVLGMTVVAALYIDLPLITWILGIAVGSLLHPLSTTIAWVLKMKDSPL